MADSGIAHGGRSPRGYGGPTMRVNLIGGFSSCAEGGTGLESVIRVALIRAGSWAIRYATSAGLGCLGPHAGVDT
jgi:hypothetical protein